MLNPARKMQFVQKSKGSCGHCQADVVIEWTELLGFKSIKVNDPNGAAHLCPIVASAYTQQALAQLEAADASH